MPCLSKFKGKNLFEKLKQKGKVVLTHKFELVFYNLSRN